jgi:hypothetical protein
VSNIDIYAVLEKFKADWDHVMPGAANVIQDIIEHFRKAEQTGYFGTLYRTDFEVEGAGAFPIDMLRYTNAWPKGETDSQAIEDSFDDDIRAASPRRGPRTITLSKYHRDPEAQLAADRWAAKFRWRVVRVIETVPV